MRIQTTVLVPRSADDLFRYLSDPRHVLASGPRPLDIVATVGSELGPRRYVAVSRLASRDRWEIEVSPLVPGRRLRVQFGRPGKPPSGWFDYELEPHDGGTVVRTTGEVRSSLAIRAINALLNRFRRVPTSHRDFALEAKVTRWLAENPLETASDQERSE